KELEQLQEVERFRQKVNNPLEQIMGDSPVIKKLKSTILKIVESKATTVLIQGESGTGKELVARAIHYASNRRLKPFIDINCTSIPDELLESELFGHEKGAFTDAKKEKKGLFELSNGGTLFLDEIGDMKTAMQAKLLRVLQEKNFTRVGGTKKIYVDVRIVAATNKDLEKAITNGQFREDLYYRLNVVRVECPPLRDRGKDILLLAKFFINQFNLDFNKSVTKINPLAENLLVSYNWKGNVRELKNVLERAILLESEDILMPEDLSINSVIERLPSPVNQLAAVNEDLTLEEMEKWLIEKTLQRLLWNKNLVAKKLGINRTTLYTKIKKYNLERS
ncbi:sigma-54-dependent Fis family transcriptional regulator, partial [bacterium]|nr:sigma-54-dependent Fis family transcriptional regulator [bacterium]